MSAAASPRRGDRPQQQCTVVGVPPCRVRPAVETASADEAANAVVEAGGRRISGPSDVPTGRLAVVEDIFGNQLLLLELSKGRYVTDELGRVTGVE